MSTTVPNDYRIMEHSSQSVDYTKLSSALADWFNKILCNDPTIFQSRRLQGVVFRSDYQTRKPDETELQRDIDGFIAKYPRSNGIWGIHAAGTSFAHIHWLHLCSNYHRQDCKCRITTYIRQQRFTIKWDRKFATEHLVSRLVATIVYLFQSERKYLAIQFFGASRPLPEDLYNRIENYRNSKWEPSSEFSLERKCIEWFSQTYHVPENSESIQQDQRIDDDQYARDEFKICNKTINHLYEKVKEIIQSRFPNNLTELQKLKEFKELTKEIRILQCDQIQKWTSVVWNDFLDEWNNLPLEKIIEIRNCCIWSEEFYDLNTSLEIAKTLLWYQFRSRNKCKCFMKCVYATLNKVFMKQNALAIFGDPGSGKTYFITVIKKLIWNSGHIESHINKTSNFPFKNMYNKRIAIINEMNISQSSVQVVKEILEGKDVCIPIKYKSRQTLRRIPIFITTNNFFLNDFTASEREAFKQRMFVFYWTPQPWLKRFNKDLHPMVLPLLYKDDFKIIKAPHKIKIPNEKIETRNAEYKVCNNYTEVESDSSEAEIDEEDSDSSDEEMEEEEDNNDQEMDEAISSIL